MTAPFQVNPDLLLGDYERYGLTPMGTLCFELPLCMTYIYYHEGCQV
jgi:hypothetical protein